MSIFQEYYTEQKFTDRFEDDPSDGIDVIIPVYHTNELWRANLFSIYREVPVRRLLISDGGVIDDSIEIVKQFPRVEVLDHRHYKSLGKCIAELIKEVSAEWFIYLHSDVYLPKSWFDKMIKYKGTYDWYGCPMNITALVNYRLQEPRRPYAGSQIGKKEAFVQGLDSIEDDYVYRQEDFVFNRIVEDAGYKTGKVEDAFHYHQVMYRESKGFTLEVTKLNIETNTSAEERQRADDTQIKGIVKYLDPIEPYVIDDFKGITSRMIREGDLEYKEFKEWVNNINPKWNKYLTFSFVFKIWAKNIVAGIRRILFK